MAASDETRWWCYLLRPTRPHILQTGPTPAEAELMGAHWAYTTPPPSSSGGRSRGAGGLFTAELHPFERLADRRCHASRTSS